MEQNNVTINGVTYNWDQLSDNAKKLILNMREVDNEIRRLQNLLTFCQTAKAAYAQALQGELGSQQ